jgi:hypothetical protein
MWIASSLRRPTASRYSSAEYYGALVGDFEKARIHHLADLLAVGAQRIGGTRIPMDVEDL